MQIYEKLSCINKRQGNSAHFHEHTHTQTHTEEVKAEVVVKVGVTSLQLVSLSS